MIEILLCVIAALLLVLCLGVCAVLAVLAGEALKKRQGTRIAEEENSREKEERARKEKAFMDGIDAIMNYSYADALKGSRRDG